MECYTVGALLLLLFASAFFSCSEIAFFSIPKAKIFQWRTSPIIEKRLTASLLSRSKDLLILIFFLNTLVNGLVQNLSSNLFTGEQGAFFLKILLPFFLILLLGEYLPKYIGLIQGEKIALKGAHFFTALKKVLHTPLQKLSSFAESISSNLFFFLKPEPPIRTEDVDEIMKTAQEIGLLTTTEASLITKVIDLKAASVADELIPMSEIPKVQDSTIDKSVLLSLYKESKHRLIALVHGSSEELQGVIDGKVLVESTHIKDQAKKHLSFIPETMPIDRLFHHMIRTKTTYAAVYDEHGKILGILSENSVKANLLESLFVKTSHIQPYQPNFFPASTLLDTINELFGTELKSQYGQKTIGGWLEEQMDTIPEAGSTCSIHSLLFRVLKSSSTHIETLLIKTQNKGASSS